MHNYRWSDLEYVLAVAGAGSVAGAARQMGVNHTTVLRRVQAFEQRMGVRVFERLRTGYRPTPEGEVYLDAAKSIETTLTDLDRKLAGSDQALSGPLSITSTDNIMPMFLDAVAAFSRLHPGVMIDLRVANVALSLDRREADIAVRASSQPPEHLVGRRVCDLQFSIYATPELAEREAETAIEDRRWLGLEAPLSGSTAGEWMAEMIPSSQIVGCANSFNALRDLAVRGLGFAMLPRHVGDATTLLINVPGPGPMPETGLWLLSHKDMLRSPRVRIASEFLYKGLRANREKFSGVTA